jgi:hypothetical protein
MAELTSAQNAFLGRWGHKLPPEVRDRLPVVQVPVTVTNAHRTGTHEPPTSGTIKIEENQTEEQRLEADYLAAVKEADEFFEEHDLVYSGIDRGANSGHLAEYEEMSEKVDTLKRQLDAKKANNRPTGGTRRHKKRGRKANSYRRTTRRHKKRGKKANSHRRKH